MTGASSGIGLAIAAALLADGHDVLAVSRTRPHLEHDNLLIHQADVRDMKTPTARIDWLIHCAGTQEPVGTVARVSPDAWAESIQTNLIGTYRTVHAVLPSLRGDGDSRILLFSGGGAFNPRAGYSAYAAAKAGTVALMETLAAELRGRVAVNCVAPGFVPTPIHAPSVRAGFPIPEATGGEMARVVACVRHLLSGQAGGLTGKTVSAVHDDWRSITPDRVAAINRSDVWTRTRVSAREETTDFVDGRCRRCANATYNQHENGTACDACGRRLAFSA